MAGAVQQAALLLPCQEKEIKKMVPGWLYAVKTKIEEETHFVFLAKHLFVCCSSSHIDNIEER